MAGKNIWLCVVLSLLAVPAFAANKVKATKHDVVVDEAFCQALVKHTPDADVTYQPGVDVNGNKVASADLPEGSTMQLPKKLNIPLTVSLAKALNLNTIQYPYSQLGQGTEVQLGTLTVEGDHVLFNGKPISDEQQNNLAVLCLKPNAQ